MMLAAIWADVLKLERVGRHDNFFSLGGHSLLAAQVVLLLQRTLNRQIKFRDLFAHPELANLADFLGSAAPAVLQPITRVARKRQPAPLAAGVVPETGPIAHGIAPSYDDITRDNHHSGKAIE